MKTAANLKNPAPAIVVVGYNRPSSLERLLDSLAKAHYPDGVDIPLVISLDHAPSQAMRDALMVQADAFEWGWGSKEVRSFEHRQGLKAHLLACGDLSQRFGRVIVLEDDLLVSPWFYRWAVAASDFAEDDRRIAGVALYSPRFNEGTALDFTAVDDGSDNFYLQVTCSWGQCFSAAQWRGFRKWLGENPGFTGEETLQAAVCAWPETSWVKHHMKYLAETGRTFLYPRTAYATNFADRGQHFERAQPRYHVPLAAGWRVPRLSGLDESAARYDHHFEPAAEMVLWQLDENLGENLEDELVCDLAGKRDLSRVSEHWVLTTRPVRRAVKTWDDALLPLELNVLLDLRGQGISLARRQDVEQGGGFLQRNRMRFRIFERDYPFSVARDLLLLKAWRGVLRVLGLGAREN